MVAEETGFSIFEGDPSSFNGGLDSDYGMESPIGGNGAMGQDFDLDLSEATIENGSVGAALAEESYSNVGESEIGSESLFQATGIFTDIGPNDFELDLSEAVSENVMPSGMTLDAGDDEVDISDVEIGESEDSHNMALFDSGVEDEAEIDLSEEALGSDEVEGLGFGSDSADEVNVEIADDDDLDLDLNIDPDTDVSGDLNLDTDEVSLDDETDLDLSSDDDVMAEITSEDDSEGGIEFDLDMGEETDEPILVDDEDPAVGITDDLVDGSSLDIEGLELEAPPENEDPKE